MPRLTAQDEQDLARFLQDLVRIRSLSAQEGALAQRLADEMRRVGIPDVWVDEMGNVIGCFGNDSGPVLALTDTWTPLMSAIQHLGVAIRTAVIFRMVSCLDGAP